jgi:DNA-binding FadR family transcriptional regulator
MNARASGAAPGLGGYLPKIVASDVERSLRERIAAGEWTVSGRIPPERNLATEYGVARNTVRRALEEITNHGILESHVGRGTFLKEQTRALYAILQYVTGASPADLIQVRLIVEPEAAALTANRASSSDLNAIADAHVRASEAVHMDEFDHWDSQFHQRVFAATRNELLVSIHRIQLSVLSRRALTELRRNNSSEDHRRYHCVQHSYVLAALKTRDARAAAESMRDHIKSIEAALLGRREKWSARPIWSDLVLASPQSAIDEQAPPHERQS